LLGALGVKLKEVPAEGHAGAESGGEAGYEACQDQIIEQPFRSLTQKLHIPRAGISRFRHALQQVGTGDSTRLS